MILVSKSLEDLHSGSFEVDGWPFLFLLSSVSQFGIFPDRRRFESVCFDMRVLLAYGWPSGASTVFRSDC
jgi:hypothetical protein